MASACLFLLENYNGDDPINIGVGQDTSLRDLATRIAAAAGYTGETRWDTSRPDGTPRRLMDVTRLTSMGWAPSTDLDAGIAEVVAWFREHRDDFRE